MTTTGPNHQPEHRSHPGPDPKPRRRVQKSGTTVVDVDAAVDRLWAIVRDVTRTGEWSHECVECTWLDGATEAVPGARFRGRNRQGAFRWGRICEVVRAEPYELVYRTVPTTFSPDSTEWSIQLERVGDRTRITQRFEVIRAPKLLDMAYAILIPAHRDRDAKLIEDLRRLGALAVDEGSAAAGSSPASPAGGQSSGKGSSSTSRV